MLCSRENVVAAYELCRSQSISDYVLFWPMTHDPQRLLLATHQACDAFERGTFRGSGVRIDRRHRFHDTAARPAGAGGGRPRLPACCSGVGADLRGFAGNRRILLDVDMPGMSGMDLLRLLKGTPRFAEIPIIMLTVTREREMVLEALRDGAADFIVKPFDRDTLLQKIRRVAGGQVTVRSSGSLDHG